MTEELESAKDELDEAIFGALSSRAEVPHSSSQEDEALIASAVDQFLGATAVPEPESDRSGGVPWLAVVGLVAAAAALAMFLLPAFSGSEAQLADSGPTQAVLEAQDRTTAQPVQDSVKGYAVESAEPESETQEGEAPTTTEPEPEQQVDPQAEPAPTGPDTRAKKAQPKLSADEMLQQARQQRSQKQFKAAARTYEQFLKAYPKSKKVPATLVSLAQLYQGPLSDPARALRHYDRYLKRGGPLAEEAHYGKIRALRSMGRQSAAKGEIEAFLSSYPNSAYADALSK